MTYIQPPLGLRNTRLGAPESALPSESPSSPASCPASSPASCPEDSVGRHMTTRFLVLETDMTVRQALRVIHDRGAEADTLYALPVVDPAGRPNGMVALRDLVLGAPEDAVAAHAATPAARARPDDPAEGVARLMRETGAFAVPVVDGEERLVGLLTVDAAVEVIEDSDTEDIARQSGTEPWTGHYLAATVWRLARYRVVWLLLLLIAATLTVTVTEAFESTLEQVTQLATFIPLLIGTGGNAGAQAATAAVRALAVGEVRVSDLPTVVWRECRVGVVLGAILALLGLVLGTLFVGVHIAVVVAVALVIICGWAATVGGTMPLLAKRLGIDPAVVSAPMVTTLVDATGLVIYFLTARAVLGL
ncbi:magnesium transporter [Streptomyces sp. LP11]|uniref:Magnesium transporter MgtE n=1 Tax=Streptomyces pyxinicus TaxID=2970331 RepID=A0ABT2B1D7_9ACTN|nr:magnesium transporter [Streptomyces sp. LP11]MCS0602335.1 magnesium transporter [Streptomyces sp. LP11]